MGPGEGLDTRMGEISSYPFSHMCVAAWSFSGTCLFTFPLGCSCVHITSTLFHGEGGKEFRLPC